MCEELEQNLGGRRDSVATATGGRRVCADEGDLKLNSEKRLILQRVSMESPNGIPRLVMDTAFTALWIELDTHDWIWVTLSLHGVHEAFYHRARRSPPPWIAKLRPKSNFKAAHDSPLQRRPTTNEREGTNAILAQYINGRSEKTGAVLEECAQL